LVNRNGLGDVDFVDAVKLILMLQWTFILSIRHSHLQASEVV